MNKKASQERLASSGNGFVFLTVAIVMIVAAVAMFISRPAPSTVLMSVVGLIIAAFCFTGLYMLQPNQVALLTLFGSYRGSDRSEGLRWANPFCMKTTVSVRARNFNSEKLKVNDLRGNPIEIAAAIVWRIEDTAQATFDVDSYETYVLTQAESALRHLAMSYAYDNLDEPTAGQPHGPAREVTLRSSTDEVAAALRAELQARFALAGIVVIDAKLTHLAYAPEIAGTMLRRQQAEAIIAARTKIVQGAVGMVELALNGLAERGLLQLDDERKAAMVSNLLVVLCSDHDATPVVNTGTLYA
jgi:regulator of protease activity HflC (stomatin/prohibitin superfamily)